MSIRCTDLSCPNRSMFMKRMIRIVALLMAALMAVTSCQAPDSGSQLAGETVDVSFMGPSARTITTDDGLVQTVATSDLWFEYKAVWKGEGDAPSTATTGWTSLSGPGLSSTIKLHRGTWNLSLRAFVNRSDVGTEGKFILSGTREVEIGTNNMVTQTVSINLGYVRQEGNGTLHVSATYPVVYHETANPGDPPVEAVRKVKVTANVAGTDYTGDITAFDSGNVGTLDLTVPAGAAHVTVQYYMDGSTLFEGDQASKDVLIMATMTTNLAVSVDRDITAITFKAEQPEGTVEDNVLPKASSLFDIYPGTIADNEIVIGYTEETKALGDQTPITYPYTILTSAAPDSQGRYNATDLGLVPITVTTGADLIASGATSAWWGKNVASDTWVNENTTLAAVRFVDGITAIGNYAFYQCSSLTNVSIPNSVTSIGEDAFGLCTSLTSITIPDSVTSIETGAFWGCYNLTGITIPNSVTSIGWGAFSSCTGLTDIVIPEGVTSIGNNTFNGCTSLTSVTIPSSVTSLGENAFYRCTSLTSVTIPEGVTSIGYQAFQKCNSLTNVTIPSSVTSIGAFAFESCIKLTSITIPEGVTSIGNSTFSNCPSLTSVTIPSSVTSIGNSAFSNCSSLTSVTIPNGVISIASGAFEYCTGLTSVTIPDSVTSIEGSMFQKCTSLTSVTISNNVTSIGNWTFYGCTGLTSVTIPDGVTSIGNKVFYGCTGLTSITLPGSVTEIGASTFEKCTSLTDIYVEQAQNDTLFANAGLPEGCRIHWNSTVAESV